MTFQLYDKKYKNQVIALILALQNLENKVDVSFEEQPDINDIPKYYLANGGGFWIAVDEETDTVVGTIGLMKKQNGCGVLKKFFVAKEFRGREHAVSSTLYDLLIEHAAHAGIRKIVLDTPANCKRAHGFYEKKGFVKITKEELPVQYDYPERHSDLYLLPMDKACECEN